MKVRKKKENKTSEGNDKFCVLQTEAVAISRRRDEERRRNNVKFKRKNLTFVMCK